MWRRLLIAQRKMYSWEVHRKRFAVVNFVAVAVTARERSLRTVPLFTKRYTYCRSIGQR